MSLPYANSTITAKINGPTINWTLFNKRADIGGALTKERAVDRCVFARYYPILDIPNPYLLLVPSRFKANTLYSQIPTNGVGDFNLQRALDTATRVNSSGYIEQSSAHIARLDYYTSGGVAGCPSLLVEKSSTNLFQRSEEFNNAFWGLVGLDAFGAGSIANTTGTLDPNGGNNADYIEEDTSTGPHTVVGITAGNTSGQVYTASIFAKQAGRTNIVLLNNAGGGGTARFNLVSGTISNITNATGTIENYGNGWWRCTMTYTSSASGNHNINFRITDDSGNESYAGTGNRGLFVFGASLDPSPFATSYIPTTTTGLTRNPDSIVLAGDVDGNLSKEFGSIYLQINPIRNIDKVQRTILDIGTTNNRIFIGYASGVTNQIRFLIQTADGNSVDFLSPAITPGVIRIAIAYENTASAMYVNGQSVSPIENGDFSGFMSALENIYLGSSFDGGNFFNGHISAFSMYNNRLSNEQLQYLSTL